MGSDVRERARAYELSSRAVREAAWFDDELARQWTILSAFCVDRLLVSQAQYALFVGRTGHRAPGHFSGGVPAAGLLGSPL